MALSAHGTIRIHMTACHHGKVEPRQLFPNHHFGPWVSMLVSGEYIYRMKHGTTALLATPPSTDSSLSIIALQENLYSSARTRSHAPPLSGTFHRSFSVVIFVRKEVQNFIEVIIVLSNGLHLPHVSERGDDG